MNCPRCNADNPADYPVCAECRRVAHFPQRALCGCDACAAAVIEIETAPMLVRANAHREADAPTVAPLVAQYDLAAQLGDDASRVDLFYRIKAAAAAIRAAAYHQQLPEWLRPGAVPPPNVRRPFYSGYGEAERIERGYLMADAMTAF